MKAGPLHAGAVALLGWYLMLPPEPPNPAYTGRSTDEIIKDEVRRRNYLTSGHRDPNEPTPIAVYGAPDENAPLSEWSTLDVFDSAAACKAAIEEGQVHGLLRPDNCRDWHGEAR